MKVEFHPSTADDVNQGATFYQRARPGLESEFRNEIDAAIDRIANSRFPYSILFRIVNADCIRVLVVRHHRRHTRFGSARA